MAKGKKYSYNQQKAYYTGRGYRAGQAKKRIPYKNNAHLQSFRDGYRSAANAVKRYPDL